MATIDPTLVGPSGTPATVTGAVKNGLALELLARMRVTLQTDCIGLRLPSLAATERTSLLGPNAVNMKLVARAPVDRLIAKYP